VLSFLTNNSNTKSFTLPRPSELLDWSDPTWGLVARGVEIKDTPSAGLGAFATRAISKSSVIGIYHGELLTNLQHNDRHVAQSQSQSPQDTVRVQRLQASQFPVSSENKGSYCFSTLSHNYQNHLGIFADDDEYTLTIDAEHAESSSWCRFLNHAKFRTPKSNCLPRINIFESLVWMVASRNINVGEELCFDYGSDYNFDWL